MAPSNLFKSLNEKYIWGIIKKTTKKAQLKMRKNQLKAGTQFIVES